MEDYGKAAIIGSVMGSGHGGKIGDFGRYVIGERSNWLSLRLDEERWQSPDSRLESLVTTFNAEERSAWEEYRKAEEVIRAQRVIRIVVHDSTGEQIQTLGTEPVVPGAERALAEEKCRSALEGLRSVLKPGKLAEFNYILEQKSQNRVVSAPRFDSELIKRYVLWRVYDLGWTTERFGQFDKSVDWGHAREASKAERIGKKYQWIAYHEILACIADHYQYIGWFGENEGVQSYSGPWQEYLRDLDPSCTIRAIPGGTSWGKPRAFVVGTLAMRIMG